MARLQTHSHTTEPKTDTTTASGGPSINPAAVFQATSQQTQLFGFMKDGAKSFIKNIKDTANRVISRVQK